MTASCGDAPPERLRERALVLRELLLHAGYVRGAIGRAAAARVGERRARCRAGPPDTCRDAAAAASSTAACFPVRRACVWVAVNTAAGLPASAPSSHRAEVESMKYFSGAAMLPKRVGLPSMQRVGAAQLLERRVRRPLLRHRLRRRLVAGADGAHGAQRRAAPRPPIRCRGRPDAPARRCCRCASNRPPGLRSWRQSSRCAAVPLRCRSVRH